jgi:hypothetical protein
MKKILLLISLLFLTACQPATTKPDNQPAPITDTQQTTPITDNAPATNPVQPITYLVSTADPNKYCNGDDMDSEGFRKTITEEKPLTISETNPTEIQKIKSIINAATTGMCNTALSQLDITVSNGTVSIPPMDGWAGISIAMCSCQPEVEVNLLRIPGITNVVWGK